MEVVRRCRCSPPAGCSTPGTRGVPEPAAKRGFPILNEAWRNLSLDQDKDIDHVLAAWPYKPDAIQVRLIRTVQGRKVMQMRVELGILQMELQGRPDGTRPGGADTYLDYLLSLEFHDPERFELDEEHYEQIDREFEQFYHRRIGWLALNEYEQAVQDADHTLALMEFCRRRCRDRQWLWSHEQYRPFVLFHRAQAAALAALDRNEPEEAINQLNRGLEQMAQFYADYDAEEHYDEDELVQRLQDLRETIRQDFHVGKTLAEQLAEAIAAEEYERAARLRDQLRRREQH